VKIISDAAHDDVPKWLNAMDVLCAPSETTPRWREQFGRMLVEAMACGVTVIASDSGEIPHVISDAGVTVPERNIERLRTAIDQVLSDRSLRRTYASRGRARALAHFGWDVVAAQHLSFFEALV
jgi:phosphatidyl-myo-inositol dimannoside synthase